MEHNILKLDDFLHLPHVGNEVERLLSGTAAADPVRLLLLLPMAVGVVLIVGVAAEEVATVEGVMVADGMVAATPAVDVHSGRGMAFFWQIDWRDRLQRVLTRVCTPATAPMASFLCSGLA